MRRFVSLTVLSALAVSPSGCSSAPPERASTITPAPTPAASSDDPTASPSPSASEASDAAELKARLLSLDDMPSGWSQAKLVSTKPAGVKPASCLPLYEDPRGLKANVATEFDRGQVNSITERLYLTSGNAKQVIDDRRQLYSSCTAVTIKDKSVGTLKYKAAPVSFKNYGDDALAVRSSVDSGGFTFIADTIYTSVGDYIVVVQGIGMEPLDATEQVVKSAVDKVRAG